MITIDLHPRLSESRNRPHFGGKSRTATIYDVTLDGEMIVNGSLTPEHDAARVMAERGLDGPFQTRDANTGKLRMTFKSISAAAKHTILESDIKDTTFEMARFRPYDVERSD